MKYIKIVIIIAIASLFIGYYFGIQKKRSNTNNEITTYRVSCHHTIDYNPATKLYGPCRDPWTAHNYTTQYKVFPEQQKVILINSLMPPTKSQLTKCAVTDVENWTCMWNDESAEFGFIKGRFWQEPASWTASAEFNDYFVSKKEWLQILNK